MNKINEGKSASHSEASRIRLLPAGALNAAIVLGIVFISVPGSALTLEGLEEQQRREANPVLVILPVTLRASVRAGQKQTLKLTVQNGGGRVLNWRVQKRPAYVQVSSDSGKLGFEQKSSLTITIDASDLKPGPATGNLVFEAPGARSSPVTVSIQVSVQEARKARKQPTGKTTEQPTGGISVQDMGDEPPGAASAAGHQFGVRSSLFMPGSADLDDYKAGPKIAFFWRPTRTGPLPPWLGYELEVSYTSLASDLGADSTLLAGHANLLWRFKQAETHTLYAMAGASIVSESAADAQIGDSALGSSFDLGAGFTYKRFDVQFIYSFLVGSDNVKDGLAAAVAVMF